MQDIKIMACLMFKTYSKVQNRLLLAFVRNSGSDFTTLIFSKNRGFL